MTATAVQPTPQVTAAIGPAIDIYNRMNIIRNVLAPDLSDQELQLYAIVAERSRLDPFAKQIYAIKRGGRLTFQTGIDGFRSSAEDTGEYRGSDEPEFGPDVTDGNVVHPEWARVVVHREFANGKTLSQAAKVFWTEFYPGSGANGDMYRKMPKNQLAKCAEAAAFRKAFPKRFSDVYTPEEMAQADAAADARPVGPTARERIADRRAQIETGQSIAAAQTTSPAPAEIKAEPEASDDVVEGLFSEAEHGDLVARLKAVVAANPTLADKSATDEQKALLRLTFESIDRGVLAHLLDLAFGLKPKDDGRVEPTQAEAVALVEVYELDSEAFVSEAAALATEGRQ